MFLSHGVPRLAIAAQHTMPDAPSEAPKGGNPCVGLDPRISSRHDKAFAGSGMHSMDKFTTLEGVAAPLKMINVDTDMIIPKQYLKTIKRTGLGKGLFAEKRYRDDGSENPDFVLNKPAYRKAKILVAGDNFGCGSSREHAPWALMDFGITCVISTSFGDIFYNNCFKNGVLPIKVSPEDLEKLFDDAERGANATLSIDLEKQEIRGPDGGMVKFDIDPHRKKCLLNGLDDIGLTMVKGDKIESFENNAKTARPWV
jgi:3-isopropylmalate/(R)-2-methylmalate dehydratase small subunit